MLVTLCPEPDSTCPQMGNLNEADLVWAERGGWDRACGTGPRTIWRTRNLNRRLLYSRASACWQVG